TSGGLALKFYSSVRLDIRKVTAVKEGEETVGSRTRVKVVKNKVAPPFKQAEFDLMHDRGISREGDLLDLAIEDRLVDKSGSWLSYGEMRLGQGRENAKQFLRENPALMDELTQKILAKRGLAGMAIPATNGVAVPAASSNGEAHDSPVKTDAAKKRQAVA